MLVKWPVAGALLGILMTASLGFAEDAPPLSSADLKQLLTYIDSIGVKQNFPAPMAKNLGLSPDDKKDLPVVSIVTNDHRVYFCRSGLDTKDYIIWVIAPDQKSSAMFVTHQDLRLTRALYLHADATPQLRHINESEVVTSYKHGLEALSEDLRKTK
jgi:hypothetical protein